MKYGSVCSGIEAASVAWEPLGWEPQWFSETDAFPAAVLAHHFPHVPNLGDMAKIRGKDFEPIDLLVGGTPCQSFSVAGLRNGLDDNRGNLALEFLRLADATRARWVVWENVPGVLSSNGGKDFGAFLGGLGECGYGFAYRILDAQYFGVPQRRRRVFVVGHLGDWRAAAAVLLERESLLGNPTPRKQEGKGVADSVAGSLGRRGTKSHTELDGHGAYIPETPKGLRAQISPGYNPEEDTLIAFNTTQITSPDNRSNPKPGDPCHTLAADSHPPAVLGFSCKDHGGDALSECAPTLRSMNEDKGHANAGGQAAVCDNMRVRRLTPVECERLQGFPDNWTLIEAKGRGVKREVFEAMHKFYVQQGCSDEQATVYAKQPDGTRYKAIGNSMAVPVMRWIGERISEVDKLIK